jgi:hypothetical protein
MTVDLLIPYNTVPHHSTKYQSTPQHTALHRTILYLSHITLTLLFLTPFLPPSYPPSILSSLPPHHPLAAPAGPDMPTEEKDMEAEFASWQAKVGPDFRALESALKPVERWVHCFCELHGNFCVLRYAISYCTILYN